MERYKVIAEYNRGTEVDKLANFGIYLADVRQWFQCLTVPVLWGDTAKLAATHTTRAVPEEDGMRTVFVNEFLQGGYARYQKAILRKRKQGINEPGAEYYYEIMNLCRLVNPAMTEEEYLFNGSRPTLVEKVWVMQPKTSADFLAVMRLHTEAAELVSQREWAVHMMATEKEREEAQTKAGEVVELWKRQGRGDKNRVNVGAANYQHNDRAALSRTADGKPICFYCKEAGPQKRD
ncbi:hypothetical protein OUZ56_011520 [Daphnia magna]|uniref:Retrotransposon gag domain-containing protein n=1 Tax=Daphnia magna TaxID=35525 RepID=A0ABQ9Z0D7_9CRUS|nr:hypothetical protein OUZ56_011520 [Daphnia magna]